MKAIDGVQGLLAGAADAVTHTSAAISKFEIICVVIPGRDHRPKADDREPGIQESLSPVTGFRVRLRFASAPRNDEVDVRCDMIDFMESLY